MSSRRPGALASSCRAASHWRCCSRACSARSRRNGSHARSACDLHRWGCSTPSGPGVWRPPPELSTVECSRIASRRPSARALSCPAASHWRCFSRASCARSRCNGSDARSACDLHRWGDSTPSGPGSWRPPPELRAVALYRISSRRPGARTLSCRAASHWRCFGRACSARSRCNAITRGARVTSIDGATAQSVGLGDGARTLSSALLLSSA